ncbi:MAG TPA: DUF6325 family protein [Solirubrobacteraceae bacterium]|nr:DUF6325 family protein [Solirubrobacteraceae bacterium]
MRFGPVQLLVVGLERADSSGEVLSEFERLRDSDAVRTVDVLVVHRNADGVVERSDEPEGAVVAALIGLADDDAGALPAEEELWSLDDVIPSDSAAVVALVEHRWAIGVRDAVRAAGGVPVADAWIHPADLVAVGLTDVDDARMT